MKAIILAAGRGTRIRPLSDEKPKCLLKVNGKSILQTNIDILKSCGVNEIVVIKGYKEEMIKYKGIKYYHNHNYNCSEQLVSFFCARYEMDGPFLLLFADVLFQKQIVQGLIRQSGEIIMVLETDWKKIYKRENEYDWQTIRGQDLVWKENNKVIKVRNGLNDSNYKETLLKAYGEWIGIAKFSNEGSKWCVKVCNDIDKGHLKFQYNIPLNKAKMIHFFQELLNKGYTISSYDIKCPDKWKEINTIEDLNKAKNCTIFEK